MARLDPVRSRRETAYLEVTTPVGPALLHHRAVPAEHPHGGAGDGIPIHVPYDPGHCSLARRNLQRGFMRLRRHLHSPG